MAARQGIRKRVTSKNAKFTIKTSYSKHISTTSNGTRKYVIRKTRKIVKKKNSRN